MCVCVCACVCVCVCMHLVGIFEELTTRMHVTENLKISVKLSGRHIGETSIANSDVFVF
jgi:hypothetical protein